MSNARQENDRWGYLHHCFKFSPAGTNQRYIVLMLTTSPEEPTFEDRLKARNSTDNIYLSLS